MNFQLYKSYSSTEPPVDLSIDDLVDYIRSNDALRRDTLYYRQLLADGDGRADSVKKQTPLVAFSFRMEGGRKEEDCREPHFMVLIDFDAKDSDMSDEEFTRVCNRMANSAYTFIGHRSISGRGYHAIIRFRLPDGIELDMQNRMSDSRELFRRAHRAINDFMSDICGARFDEQVGNPNRIVGIAHDPDVVYCPEAMVYSLTRGELGVDLNGNIIRQQRPIVVHERTAGAEGDDLFRGVSADSHFDAAVRMIEAEKEFVKGQRHEFLVRLSFLLNKMGVIEEEAAEEIDRRYAELMKTDNRRGERAELPSKILQSIYRRAADQFGIFCPERRKRKRKSETTVKAEVIADFLKDKRLRYDEVSRKIQHEVTVVDGRNEKHSIWRELTEIEINDMLYDCNITKRENLSKQTFLNVLQSTKVAPRTNPFREYLKSLPEWDQQTDYIQQVADMVHLKQDEGLGGTEVQSIWENCFRKWFVAMIMSWNNPDVVNHQVLVLIGEQGIYKTTWLDRLLPPELAQYGSKQTAMERLDKDEQLRATEYGLINLDEIDKLSERGLNELKSIITNTAVDVRPAYGHVKEKRNRIASYVASGNKQEFLTDQTGNRRWLPFHVESIDSPWDHPLPYEGMYAQAMALIKSGYNYWFTLEDTQHLQPHVDQFMLMTREEQLLNVYFRPAPRYDPNAVRLTAAEILAKIKMYGNIGREINVRQMGSILKKNGYEMMKAHGIQVYLVFEKSDIEIQNTRKSVEIEVKTDENDPTVEDNTTLMQELPF